MIFKGCTWNDSNAFDYMTKINDKILSYEYISKKKGLLLQGSVWNGKKKHNFTSCRQNESLG